MNSYLNRSLPELSRGAFRLAGGLGWFLGLFLLLAALACGGKGGGASAPPPPPPAPSNRSYPNILATVNGGVSAAPSVTGTVTSYALVSPSPALPAGLRFDSSTGAIHRRRDQRPGPGPVHAAGQQRRRDHQHHILPGRQSGPGAPPYRPSPPPSRGPPHPGPGDPLADVSSAKSDVEPGKHAGCGGQVFGHSL